VTVLRRWIRVALAGAAGLPLLDQLQAGTRKGVLLGATLGLLLFLPLGALRGYLNRGTGGALIGAISGSLGGVILSGIVGGVLGSRHFPQEGTLLISIEFDAPNASYAPGEYVSGRVRATAESTLKIGEGTAYVVCRGFYVHDEIDESNAVQLRFVRQSSEYLVEQAGLTDAAIIRRRTLRSYPFRFFLPLAAFPTHQGYVCSVRWTLHAVVDVPDLPSAQAHREFLVESAPPMPLRIRGECQSIVVSQVCQLILGLPRAVYAEGDAVRGHVHIIPTKEFDTEEVRALLLRIENVQASDDHIVYVVNDGDESGDLRGQRRPGGHGTTYVWLEGEDVLSGPATFRPAQTVTRLFSLPIPSHWRPTLSTGEGSVIWKVGVVVSRPGARDVRAFHEVIVHTGALQISGQPAASSVGPAA